MIPDVALQTAGRWLIDSRLSQECQRYLTTGESSYILDYMTHPDNINYQPVQSPSTVAITHDEQQALNYAITALQQVRAEQNYRGEYSPNRWDLACVLVCGLFYSSVRNDYPEMS